MRYVLLSLAFLVVAVAMLALALAVRDDRRRLVARWWLPACCTGAVLLVLTAVFDNVMIAIGLMTYPAAAISGWRIGAAPLEDFAYPLAALVLLPAVWLICTRRGGRG